MTALRTTDGTWFVRDAATGLVATGRSRAEAEAELRRLLTVREAA